MHRTQRSRSSTLWAPRLGRVRTPHRFSKGHGTGNDFVVLPDPDGELDLDEATVAAICDRRFGIGADGVLRVVRTERASQAPDIEVVAAPGAPEWFMDYRNADGSVAAMCGNGIRVYARFLIDRGLAAPGRVEILTRGGVRSVDVPRDGDIAVDMGPPDRDSFPERTAVSLAGRAMAAHGIGMPNPHAVVLVKSLSALPDRIDELDVDHADFPDGANVEFVSVISAAEPAIRLRVVERGVGETLSCGTGACAAAVVAAQVNGLPTDRPMRVEVPGGSLMIEPTAVGSVRMTGPAELVADGTFRPDWIGGRR